MVVLKLCCSSCCCCFIFHCFISYIFLKCTKRHRRIVSSLEQSICRVKVKVASNKNCCVGTFEQSIQTIRNSYIIQHQTFCFGAIKNFFFHQTTKMLSTSNYSRTPKNELKKPNLPTSSNARLINFSTPKPKHLLNMSNDGRVKSNDDAAQLTPIHLRKGM